MRATGLTKRYGERAAVEELSFTVPRGMVTGFIGPNGSGKTTTLRMLLGLVRPSTGRAEVLGATIERPGAYLSRVGALIEGPAFYPTLSGRANLRTLAELGNIPRARIDVVLEQVGLSDRGDDAFSHYSLGMKQSLGIAAALLPEPELLMLDEPTNALDPAGIRAMRGLLADRAREGTSVLVSSHQLGELERIAQWLIIVRNGRLLFEGPTQQALDARGGSLEVRPEDAADLDRLAVIAREAGEPVTVVDGGLRIAGPAGAAAVLNRRAMAADISLAELHYRHDTLEDTFLAMTDVAA